MRLRHHDQPTRSEGPTTPALQGKVDYGSDFTSRHLEQVAVDLKIRLIFSTAGKPRGRGKIERFFKSLSQVFLSRLPGYGPGRLRRADAAGAGPGA